MNTCNARVRVLAFVTLLSMLSGCATVGGSPSQSQTTQQKIAKCAAMVLGGALLGNLIGKDSKSTAAGAALGGAACGVWMAFNNAADKKRLEEAQVRALQAGQSRQESWRGEDGKSRSVQVQLGEETSVQTAASGTLMCRPVDTTVTANGSNASNSEEWCRTPDGRYRPRSELVAAA